MKRRVDPARVHVDEPLLSLLGFLDSMPESLEISSFLGLAS